MTNKRKFRQFQVIIAIVSIIILFGGAYLINSQTPEPSIIKGKHIIDLEKEKRIYENKEQPPENPNNSSEGGMKL
ncbi:hypothetical protein [Virgibacillus salexigens]|uniref:hypothetical protein n=1 Tax=Virgibacillus massiliensis TaxID=1462526 RepID=UPI00137110CD|nr:hypothetical protein [Virgibacillus massiliensis]MYL43954.1 hypothetical protein [Virgibacillus massiliensis]